MYYINYGDRFVLPFILGGIVGAGAVGLSRPRPVFVNQVPYPYPMYPYYIN